jgi:hypothetical protein
MDHTTHTKDALIRVEDPLALARGLWDDARELLTANLEAAKLEVKETVGELATTVKRAAAAVAVGGVALVLAAIAVAQAIASLGLETWAANGIVALALAALALVLARRARTPRVAIVSNVLGDRDGMDQASAPARR